jgi:glycosyltransferase involved in cell wall biosynthesis
MTAAALPRVTLALPTLLTGGTEAQTLTLAAVLLEAGWDVTVCCYHESDQGVVAAFERAGTRVALLGLTRKLGLTGIAGELRNAFRALRPDVVHVQYLAPGFTAVLAARAAGVQTVFATVHQPGSAYGFRERLLLRGAARMCTAFFAVSLAVERSWFRSAAIFDPLVADTRRHFTMYNAVAAKSIMEASRGGERAALRRSLGVEHAAAVVGYVGRLRREKGLDVLIRALPAVVQCHPAVRLLVVGAGPDAGALRELSVREGIAGHMVWSGMRSQLEAWRLFGMMDVVAVPSRFEGFGLVAAEAQAAGLPVVASGVGGLREVVCDGETGILVPPGEPAALAKGIETLLADPPRARRLGIAGQRHVAEAYSPERFAASVQAVYTHYTGFAGR